MSKKSKLKSLKIRNLIVVSDLHCGCRLGLCPPGPIQLDDGGTYAPSKTVKKVWDWWEEFWYEWVPLATEGEPYAILINGDAVDGRHHNSVTQVSQNLTDQARIARLCIAPVLENYKKIFKTDPLLFWTRGTEAHVGSSSEMEERLAEDLGAIPNEEGQFARYELLVRLGGRALVHCMHHIGTAGSTAYESSALMREFSESCVEASRWDEEVPNVIVRSHRHRCTEVRVQTAKGFATVCTTASFQLKTPFSYRIAGARQALPQIGGCLVRCGHEEVFTRQFVRNLSRGKEVVI